ncbi:hypothetical protein HID58_013153 [Brassica napus]|uniref:Replication protein A OB domain-containing protein n=1 Tax=Brassica napus TaxID=3708 RepID=A0ABQ8E5W7_BRANA|nr:hypothetical protein HID58_013153 [Brassica napus]
MMVEVKGEDRKRVLFRLRDTSGNEVACCLWGQYAEQIESHIAESNDDTIICLIRFAKISEFRGEMQITNAYDASLLVLNPTMDEAIDFKQKMMQVDLPLALLGNSDEKKIVKQVKVAWNEVDVKCISEILISDEIEDPEILPIPIKNLVGKSFCFGLSITSDNVNNGSTTFKVAEVWSGDHIHRIESLSEPVSLIGSTSSTLSTGEVPCIDYNKESSSEDVTTPFSKRKEGDAELNDMNSTSKKKTEVPKKLSHNANERTGHQHERHHFKHSVSLERQSLSANKAIQEMNVQSYVAVRSVFKRIFDCLGEQHISKNANVQEGLTTSTPKNPEQKRRCVLGVDLVSNLFQITPQQRSCVSTEINPVHFPNQCLQSKNKRRILDDITNTYQTPISNKRNARDHLCTSTPKTPSTKRRCVLGVSSASNQTKNTPEPKSCLTAFACKKIYANDPASNNSCFIYFLAQNTHVQNQRKQQKSKTSVRNDITNVDETFTYHTVETSENTSDQIGVDHTEYDEEEMADCDVDIEGIIEEIDAELEFDVSSQESTDSEYDDIELDVSIGEKKNRAQKKSVEK